MPLMETDSTNTTKALTLLKEGSINSLAQLTGVLAPAVTELDTPGKPPTPPVLSDAQRSSIAAFTKVFGSVNVAGGILSRDDLSSLKQERDVVAVVSKAAAERTQAIRTMVLNHFAALVEAGVIVTSVPLDEVPRDKEGYPLVKAKSDFLEDGTVWSLEPSDGKVELSVNKLKEMAADPDNDLISHKDFLDMTSPIRVVDEAKLMLLLRKKPELLGAIAAATSRGRGSITVVPRAK